MWCCIWVLLLSWLSFGCCRHRCRCGCCCCRRRRRCCCALVAQLTAWAAWLVACDCTWQTFSIAALKSTYGVESDDDELQEQEEALELEEYLRERSGRDLYGRSGGVGSGGGGGGQVITKVVASGIKPQPAFQPSATPLDEGKRRFLVWNSTGTSYADWAAGAHGRGSLMAHS
jgi:hypothetical protein